MMFPDDHHFRTPDRFDNLLKAFFLKVLQTLPVSLSMRSQLLLTNRFSKHSRISPEHFRFNQQVVVEAHGMDCLQSVTLFFGKLITNEIRHGRAIQQRAPGQPDRIIEHVLSDVCKYNLHLFLFRKKLFIPVNVIFRIFTFKINFPKFSKILTLYL